MTREDTDYMDKKLKSLEYASLPIIDSELWEMFNDTALMTYDIEKKKPIWTQVAGDFVSMLKTRETWEIK